MKGVKLSGEEKKSGIFCSIFLVSVFLTPFDGLLPPLPGLQCAIFLDFWNLGEKKWKEVVSKTFTHKVCKIAETKKS